MTPDPSAIAHLRAHGLDLRWIAIIVLVWIGVSAFGAIALPFKHPHESYGHMVDSSLLVALIVPVIVMARCLDEGVPHAVETASQRLVLSRLLWVAAYFSSVLVIACLSSFIVPLPRFLYVTDALMLAAFTVLGMGTLGSRLGPVVPVLIALTFASPGVIPWEINLVYRQGIQGWTLGISVATALLGTAFYARWGLDHLMGRSRRSSIVERVEYY